MTNDKAKACPCGSGKLYSECCAPCHDGSKPAVTAEQLMRSRYSAFALGNTAYLVETVPVEQQVPGLEEDIRTSMIGVNWLSLKIVCTEKGGERDKTGFVEFIATYFESGVMGTLHEKSRFRKIKNLWFYVDGTIY